MVRYYLLRDNHETGPYTQTELKEKTLFTTDLIWIEDESKCWRSPNEIPGLEGMALTVKKTAPAKPKQRPANDTAPAFPVQSSASLPPGRPALTEACWPPDDYTPPSFELLQEKYAQKKPQKRDWKRQIHVGASLMGLFTLFIGLGLSAYMVKKAVENIEFEPVVASAESVEISPESLPNSRTAHAAFADVLPAAEKPELVPDTVAAPATKASPVNNPENRLPAAENPSKEWLQNTAAPEEPAASDKAVPQATTAKTAASVAEMETTGSIAAGSETAALTENEKKEEGEKPDAKPLLRLSANHYNVGFLGGISNLEILVSNPSSQEVSKALVEVEFLRKNGKVVGTQTVTVSGIAPGGAKTVSIPDNSRGVSVRYKVVKVES